MTTGRINQVAIVVFSQPPFAPLPLRSGPQPHLREPSEHQTAVGEQTETLHHHLIVFTEADAGELLLARAEPLDHYWLPLPIESTLLCLQTISEIMMGLGTSFPSTSVETRDRRENPFRTLAQQRILARQDEAI